MAASRSAGRCQRCNGRKSCRAVSLVDTIEMLERAKGIEPSYAAWEAAVLPLNYARNLPVLEPAEPLNIKVRSGEPDRRQDPRRSRLVVMKYVEAGRGSGEAQLPPAFDHAVIGGAAQQGGLRELLEMLMRLACVDQDFRSVGARLGRKLAGIEPGGPGGAQQVEILGRMAARAQRPQHVVHVGRVDVVVHRDDPL